MLLTGCSGVGVDRGSDAGDGLIRVSPGQRGAPIELSGDDLDGKPIDLSGDRGKPVVVNIWGSWCGPCTAEAPVLVDAAKELGSQADFLGITSREVSTIGPKDFERRFSITYPSLFDPEGKALLAFRGGGAPTNTPTTIILDAQGRYAAALTQPVTTTTTLVGLVEDIAAGE